MYNQVTLSDLKNHLRIDENNEDVILQLYLEAAHEYAEKFLNKDLASFGLCPPAIKAAILLTAADLFENREGAGDKEIKENPAVKRLLFPHRIEMGI